MSEDFARLLDATWPAAERVEVGPFTLRRGEGGGKRVSAATASGAVTEADIAAAEQAMDDRGQQAMFAVGSTQRALDRMLVERAYLTLDPTRVYQVPIRDLANPNAPADPGSSVWPPIQVQKDIWTAGNIGPAHLAVMDRVAGPKTAILGRSRDDAAGAGFVAVHERIAMVHALVVLPHLRRRGVGRNILVLAAHWGRENGADRLVALSTKANTGASEFFEQLGFTGADAWHYRIRP